MQRVKACSGPVCSVACPGPDQKRKKRGQHKARSNARARPAQGQWAAARRRCPPRASTGPKGARQGRARLAPLPMSSWGWWPTKSNPQNAPKRSSAFSRGAARRMPCDGVKSPTTVKLGKQRRIQKVKNHMLHRLQLQTSYVIIFIMFIYDYIWFLPGFWVIWRLKLRIVYLGVLSPAATVGLLICILWHGKSPSRH